MTFYFFTSGTKKNHRQLNLYTHENLSGKYTNKETINGSREQRAAITAENSPDQIVKIVLNSLACIHNRFFYDFHQEFFAFLEALVDD